MEAKFSPKVFFPGSVTTTPGHYRVCHSVRHRPDAESLLVPAGMYLPGCPVSGCIVAFTLLQSNSSEFDGD